MYNANTLRREPLQPCTITTRFGSAPVTSASAIRSTARSESIGADSGGDFPAGPGFVGVRRRSVQDSGPSAFAWPVNEFMSSGFPRLWSRRFIEQLRKFLSHRAA